MMENGLSLVFWETTAGCNLECIHCRRLEVSKTLMKDDLTTQESLGLIDSIKEVGEPILVLSGGEPLFRGDIFTIAKYANERGLKVSLATNGTLVSKAIAHDIKEVGIKRVAISIDGASEKTHDDFRRQKGSLKAALEGFKNLKAEGISMQINCTITKHNVGEIEDIYKLAVDLGADALHFFMLVPVGCGVTIANTNMLEAEEYEEVLKWLFYKSLEGKLFCKATCAPHYFRIMHQEAKKMNLKLNFAKRGYSAMTKGCLAGSGIIFISHKGEVFPCGYLPLNCGNIRNQRFKEIWENSQYLNTIRNANNLLGKCGVCEFKNICLGCRARAYFATGDYMSEEPYCIYEPVALRRQKEKSSIPTN
jgi:heme b synthase